jgi:hypothetical protein
MASASQRALSLVRTSETALATASGSAHSARRFMPLPDHRPGPQPPACPLRSGHHQWHSMSQSHLDAAVAAVGHHDVGLWQSSAYGSGASLQPGEPAPFLGFGLGQCDGGIGADEARLLGIEGAGPQPGRPTLLGRRDRSRSARTRARTWPRTVRSARRWRLRPAMMRCWAGSPRLARR